MSTTTTRRTAAATLTGASLLAMAGFTALGSVFDYPRVLEEPTREILTLHRAHEGAVTAWFAVLVLGAALLAPAGVLLGRLAGGRLGRWTAVAGVAAAAVQVVGLSRWVLLVPGLSRDATDPARAADAERTFELLHTWLGHALGETVGYALTAVFTLLVVAGLRRTRAPRWLTGAGTLTALLIATGVAVPLGVGSAAMTNFVGYVGWCLWLVALSVTLWREPTRRAQPQPVG